MQLIKPSLQFLALTSFILINPIEAVPKNKNIQIRQNDEGEEVSFQFCKDFQGKDCFYPNGKDICWLEGKDLSYVKIDYPASFISLGTHYLESFSDKHCSSNYQIGCQNLNYDTFVGKKVIKIENPGKSYKLVKGGSYKRSECGD